MIEPLSKNEINIWQINVKSEICQDIAHYYALTPAEQQRADKYVFEKDRYRYIVAHSILQKLLRVYLGNGSGKCELMYSAQGKPYHPNEEEIVFNISYSKDLVLIGFAKSRELGLDIENTEEDLDVQGVAAYIFNKEERDSLKQCPPEERMMLFYKIWTGKEALVKLTGIGLGKMAEQQKQMDIKSSFADLSVDHFMPEEPYLAAVASDKNPAIIKHCDTVKLTDLMISS